MVIVPLFEMAPDPEIGPSFQTRVPFWRIVSDAFIILLPVVFSVMVWPAPIVNGRPTVPLNQVMSALMVKAPAPVIDPWIVYELLMVRLPEPVTVPVLLKANEAGKVKEVFRFIVLVLIKLPVPLITEPAL